MQGSNVSPILMAWSIAVALRLALGSATVVAIIAGGFAAPLIATSGVSSKLRSVLEAIFSVCGLVNCMLLATVV